MVAQSDVDAECAEALHLAKLTFSSGPNAAERQTWHQDFKQSWIEGFAEGLQVARIQKYQKTLKLQITSAEDLEKLWLGRLVQMAIELRLQLDQRLYAGS